MTYRMLVALAAGLTLGLVTRPASAQGGRSGGAARAGEAARSQGGQEEEEQEIKIVGGGKIAAGWTAKVDRNDSLSKVKFEQMGSGWHVRTARSVMLFRATDAMSGNYNVKVTLKQTEATPGHAESYGLVLGGSGLDGDAAKQRYTTFTVRGDGKYQIRRRADGKGSDVTDGAVERAAVHQTDDKGSSTNELSVVAGASDIRFLVNGTEVHRAKRGEVDTDGIVALRISHNLDIAIPVFSVVKG